MKRFFFLLTMTAFLSQLHAAGEGEAPEPAAMMFRVHHREADSIRHRSFFKGKGFCGILDMGFTYVLGHDTIGRMSAFSFNYVMGGHVTPWYSMGLGLGFNIHSADVFDLELTGDFRFQFGKRRRLMPYLSSPGGYIAHFHADHFIDGGMPYRVFERNDGFVVNPTAGVRWAVNYRFAVTLGVGYRLTGMFYEDDYYHYHLKYAHGLTIRTGINF
jgi:hypothetical protein